MGALSQVLIDAVSEILQIKAGKEKDDALSQDQVKKSVTAFLQSLA